MLTREELEKRKEWYDSEIKKNVGALTDGLNEGSISKILKHSLRVYELQLAQVELLNII